MMDKTQQPQTALDGTINTDTGLLAAWAALIRKSIKWQT